MLKTLAIEQFVIIDKLDLDLQTNLTILTGETGAGKSILLDAMGFILGDPSNPEYIRQGSERSDLKAHFTPPEKHPIWEVLKEKGFEADPAQGIKVHRILNRKGSDEITINGKKTDEVFLKEMGTYLVEIHGQFANQSLLDPENQLTLLDLAGGFPKEMFDNVKNALRDVHKYKQELEDEKTFLARHKRQLPVIEKVVKQFESVNMREGFVEEAQEEYDRLLTAKETMEAFQSILSQLISANGIVSGMSKVNQILERQENVDKDVVADLTHYLSESLSNARSAVKEMQTIAPEYEIDTAPIYEYEKILETFKDISRTHKKEFSELYDFYVEMDTKLNRMRNGNERIKEIENNLAVAKREYRKHADILSEKRVEAASNLSEVITNELPPLKLNKAQFDVIVKQNPNMEWTERGIDEVTFTARMNPGQPFSPISETASGGELARLMLALKVVVQGVQTIPTLVFDEVDTGIGGAAAAAVGDRLAQLAENTQVLVITHSPQVASSGKQHLHVSKSTDGVTTTSVVNTLSMDQRIDEISRMLAGEDITTEAHAAAKKLIDEASLARQRAAQSQPQHQQA